ncbi:hypothetical protein J6590_080090 [Homalodisca vitripennis]|nr:hypothetical protein J6590_080090 [Homalodisca vitripennis]
MQAVIRTLARDGGKNVRNDFAYTKAELHATEKPTQSQSVYFHYIEDPSTNWSFLKVKRPMRLKQNSSQLSNCGLSGDKVCTENQQIKQFLNYVQEFRVWKQAAYETLHLF